MNDVKFIFILLPVSCACPYVQQKRSLNENLFKNIVTLCQVLWNPSGKIVYTKIYFISLCMLSCFVVHMSGMTHTHTHTHRHTDTYPKIIEKINRNQMFCRRIFYGQFIICSFARLPGCAAEKFRPDSNSFLAPKTIATISKLLTICNMKHYIHNKPAKIW